MSGLIPITPLQPTGIYTGIREVYKVKLTRDDLPYLSAMLLQCIGEADQGEGFELDVLVLNEIIQVIEKKHYEVEHKANLKLKRSQTYALFVWLNSSTFENPYLHTMACRLVDQLYKQIV